MQKVKTMPVVIALDLHRTILVALLPYPRPHPVVAVGHGQEKNSRKCQRPPVRSQSLSISRQRVSAARYKLSAVSYQRSAKQDNCYGPGISLFLLKADC
jgi:hypothetical protein